MAKPLKKDEEVTHFVLKFVTPLFAAFLVATVVDMFSLAHWTGSVISANLWEYLP